MALTHNTEHVSKGLAKLVEQLKNKPKLSALVTALLSQVQDVEDALWQLYTLRSIDTATGVSLDVLGRIVGELRGNATDDDQYRTRIRARVRTNLSSGTPNDIIAVFECFGLDVKIELQPPAGFSMRIVDSAITADDADVYLRFLLDAKAAGVQVVMEWSEVVPFWTFYTGLTAGTTALIGIGAGLPLYVDTTEGFPSSGYLILEFGMSVQETVTYTSKDAVTFYGVTTTIGHAQGATVHNFDYAIGQGFGTTSTPALGGKLAGAASGI